MRTAPLWRLRNWLLPALLLLALAVALPWLLSADSIQASASRSVPADWEYVPEGAGPGDSFRLLLVTSATRDASSSNIADYNVFVQTAANGNTHLKPFKGGFTALISTSAVDGRDNTATTGTGVSVHWLGGEKVADDYADLYDKSWDSVAGKTETGSSYTGLVWTGGNKMGQKSGQRYAGADEVRLGDLSDATLPLSSPAAGASSDSYPLYALSPVFIVAEPEPEPTPTPTPAPTPEPEPAQPANSPPAFATENATLGVYEDAAIGANVGSAITATDADSDALTYALTGSDAFAIDSSSGQITLKSSLDYETTASYSLTVSVSDGKNAQGQADAAVDDTIAVTVNVSNVDEAGAIILNSLTDPPETGSALTASLSDPDGSVSSTVWTWQRSDDGTTAWEAIAGAAGSSYTLTAEDGAHYLRATASYADGHGPGKTAVSTAVGPVAVVVTVQQPEPQQQTATTPVTGFTYTESVRCEAATDTGTRCWVPHDWPLIPTVNGQRLKSTLESAQSFRLMFVTRTGPVVQRGFVVGQDTGIDATSTTVAPYNAFVQHRANRNPHLAPINDHFRAMVQPWNSNHHMKPNTKTRSGDIGAGSPIYWVNGVKVADDYADLYDGNGWDYNASAATGQWPSDEYGADITSDDTRVWTGSASDGTNQANFQVGNNNVIFGVPNQWKRELGTDNTATAAANSDRYPLYAMSPVLTIDLEPATPPDAPAGHTVAPGWALIPSGLGHGDSFRLLFVTSNRDRAGSPNISAYNGRVQERAAANADFDGFSGQFRALISTAAINARDNTATIGAGVPIYWVNGEKVADDYYDFYDGSWDSTSLKNEAGEDASLRNGVWTGSRSDGAKDPDGNVAGADNVRTGDPADPAGTIDSGESAAKTQRSQLYALSPVITVVDPAMPTPRAPATPSIAVQVNDRDDHLVTWATPPGTQQPYAWQAQWAPKGAATWNDLGTYGAGGARHTGRNARQAHFYRVKAIGFGGESAWSYFEPTRTPDKPKGLRAVAKDGMVTVYWDDPNNPSIDGYHFTVGRGFTDDDWDELRTVGNSATVDFNPRAAAPDFDSFPPDFDWVNIDMERLNSFYRLPNGKQARIHIRAYNSRGTSAHATVIAIPNTDDKTPAYVKSVEITSTPAEGDTYFLGEVVEATVTFSRPVTVTRGGGFNVLLDTGRGEEPDFELSRLYSEELSGGFENITRLVLDIDVQSGDSAPNGLSIPQNCILLAEGAAIKYTDGDTQKDAILDCPARGPDPNHKVDPDETRAPVVRGIAIISEPGHGSGNSIAYGAGDDITVRLTLSADVDVSTAPKPTLTIRVGGDDKQADCVDSPALRNALDCAYTVQVGDRDSDGVSVAANSLRLPTNAYVRFGVNGSAPNAVLDHPALADDADHKVAAAALRAGQQPVVAPSWKYVPEGLKRGEEFRLLFVTTSPGRNSSATDIDAYNTFVQDEANSNPALQGFKGQFRALVSTETTDAKDNVAATGTGVKIYWMGGDKVADDYADFFDGSWDSRSPKDANGGGFDLDVSVRTGSDADGTKHSTEFAGAANVRAGLAGGGASAGEELSAQSEPGRFAGRYYALSPVIKVRDWDKPVLTVTGSGHGKATLTWTSPLDSSITSWSYSQRDESTDTTTTQMIDGSDATTRSHTITDLEIGREYTFQVYPAACCTGTDNDEEYSPTAASGFRSDQVTFTPLRLPSAPTDVRPYRRTANTVDLYWTKPADASGGGDQAPVTGYQILYATDTTVDGGACCGTWRVAGTVSGADTTSFKHTLPEGGERLDYIYVVQATSDAGNSVSSLRADEFHAPWEPQAPETPLP